MNVEFVKLLSLSDRALKDKAAEILKETRVREGSSWSSSAGQKGFMAIGNSTGAIREESSLTELIGTMIQSFRDAKLCGSAQEYWESCRLLAADIPEGAAMRLAAIAFREGLTKARNEGELWKTLNIPPAVAEKATAARKAVLQKRSPVTRQNMLQQLEVFKAVRGYR